MTKESNVSQSIVLFGWVVERIGQLDSSLVEIHFSRHSPGPTMRVLEWGVCGRGATVDLYETQFCPS